MGEIERDKGVLVGESRDLERQRRDWEKERKALSEENDHCDALEQDLGHVIQVIADGVESGSLKVGKVLRVTIHFRKYIDRYPFSLKARA